MIDFLLRLVVGFLNTVLELSFRFAGDDPFWAGAIAATLILVSGAVVGNWLNRGYNHWLKGIRRFFEKTRLPGEMPSKQGDSPADAAAGCLWRIVAPIVVGLVVWWVMSRAP